MSKTTRREMLIVGTRGSTLARAQTQWVIDRLTRVCPALEIRQEIITTRGDRERNRPLPEIGGKGLFTEELERALLDGSIDVAVHSAKDLPTELPEGLAVLAYPDREDPRDAWISRDGGSFAELPPDSVVGTSSLRRQAQLLMHRRDLAFVALRGNVDTRIRKVRRGDCAGAVLAMAGLNRLMLNDRVTHVFEPDSMLPAPGQGVLALEGRADDGRVAECLHLIHDEPTCRAVECERAVLSGLDAGCRAPVAVFAQVCGGRLLCEALVSDPGGQRYLRAKMEGPPEGGVKLAGAMIADLLARGADEIIAACRGSD